MKGLPGEQSFHIREFSNILCLFADTFKLIFKETIIPASADRVVFMMAPALVLIPAIIILAATPIGGTIHIPEMNLPFNLHFEARDVALRSMVMEANHAQ